MYQLTSEKYDQILDWIEWASGNRLKEIPSGSPRLGPLCPMAKATGFIFGLKYYWSPDRPDDCYGIPDYIQAFIYAFDVGVITNEDLKR